MTSVPSVPGPADTRPTNGTGLVKRRPKPLQDPFFKPKTKPTFRKAEAAPKPLPNGQLAPLAKPVAGASPNSFRSASPIKASPAPEERTSGFSDPRVGADGNEYRDYKLVTTKRDLLQGLRFHLLQFPGDKPLDIRDESNFTRPVRLHRRDPHAVPTGPPKEEDVDMKDGLDKAEREDLNNRKEARQKEREANLAQIAPAAEAAKKMNSIKKRTAQVWRNDYSAEDRRRFQNNYEEKLPWHLEDFDNKHCFIGSNQAGSSNVHAAFIQENSLDSPNGRFRLISVEKMYNFKPKPKYKTMTIEEAEAAMTKSGRDPEWLVRQKQARLEEAQKDIVSKKSKGLFFGAQAANEIGLKDEADWEYDDDFADDEEGDLFIEKDEDAKAAEKKIKEDQLQANFLGFKEEQDYDKAEELEKKEEERKKLQSKEIKKKLELREKNYNHGSDSEEDWDQSSDSEEERRRLEEEKKAKEKAEAEGKNAGVPSTGTSTPSGKKEKQGGIASDREGGIKKSSSLKSLKRPGSPNLSDASGTDASTRKKKKNRHLSSSQPTTQSARPMSPSSLLPSSSAPNNSNMRGGAHENSKTTKKRKSNAPGGAGSDTDTAAYSDGAAMSDGTKTKRLKLNPPGSTSPTALTPKGGSRAGSPKPANAQLPASTAFPTAQEIYNAIPATGISSKELLSMFRSRTADRNSEFVVMLRSLATLDKEKRLLFRKAITQTGRPSSSGVSDMVEVKKEPA